jgi:hypothetical protein
MCVSTIEKHGANPANIQWVVVRGDTAKLKVEFLENDESTYFSTSGWTYVATAYDSNGDVLDDLPLVSGEGYVELRVPPTITANWGANKYKNVVAELSFDIEATIPGIGEDTSWTPVIGTICVLGDITPGGSL